MLPPELTDHILASVDRADVATLNACATAWPQMVSTSRAYVFDIPSIELTKFGHAQTLFHLMSSPQNTINEHLASNLKTFVLGDKNTKSYQTYYCLGRLTSEIFVLQSLESLTIDSYLWTFHNPRLDQAPLFPPSLPNLTTLNLSFVHFDSLSSLANLICACPKLKTLQVWLVTWPACHSSLPDIRKLPSSLKTIEFLAMSERESHSRSPGPGLAVLHYGPLLDWILACHADAPSPQSSASTLSDEYPEFPAIERLSFRLVHNDVADGLYNLLDVAQDSLKDVSLSFLPGQHEADQKLWNHPTLRKVPELFVTRLSGVSYFK